MVVTTNGDYNRLAMVGHRSRLLQLPAGQDIPDYTSPPLADALAACPEEFRSDDVIDAMRTADAAGLCGSNDPYLCQMYFVPDGASWSLEDNSNSSSSSSTSLGIILYGGGLVDPRAYSVLARKLADEYGLLVVIPVFANDLAVPNFGTCRSGRVELAQQWVVLAQQQQQPSENDVVVVVVPWNVEKWLLVGHSLGGVGASVDAWAATQNGTAFGDDDSNVVGLVLMAADVQPDLSCDGAMDYSQTDFPVAAITATEDKILNWTRWEENKQYLPESTLFVSIEGGNHGQFGSYNATERQLILGQVDGTATIDPEEQWDLTVKAIYEIALRTGLELPQPLDNNNSGSTNTTPPSVAPPISPMPTTMTSGGAAARSGMPLSWVGTTIMLTLLLCRSMLARK